MRISIRNNSDRLALLLGSPNRLKLDYSADPQVVARALPRRADDEQATVLLLGGNGFVGINILRELLEDERIGRVYALVRPKGNQSGAARIARQARKYKMTLPSNETGDKLVVLEGSYLEPSMGLAADRYEEILTGVDIVIDGAGATTHDYSYARYRAEKVLPTLTLAEFCLTKRLKALHVIGSVGSEVYRQRRDFHRTSFFYCGYSKMKFIVKHLSLIANRAGVPIHVYQAPFALGGPHTSYKDPGLEYSFWNMVLNMVASGKTWDLDTTVPMVAGDVLARTVVNNALAAAPQPITYPVTPVNTTEFARRFELDMLPYKEFRRMLTKENDPKLSDVNWRQPISSARRAWQRGKFMRSLFPRCMPTLLNNLHVAITPPATPLKAGLPSVEVLYENATQIRKLAKHLPATTRESTREAA